MNPAASTNASLETPYGVCVLAYEPLDVASIIESVGDPTTGAKAVFIGTTRNSFQGKTVTFLEYQAYSKLCIQTLAAIVETVSATILPPVGGLPVIRSAVYHRLGIVPVGEPSIVIAVSSPHRKEAFVACEHILEQVKAKAHIWKREYYLGEDEDSAVWKANN